MELDQGKYCEFSWLPFKAQKCCDVSRCKEKSNSDRRKHSTEYDWKCLFNQQMTHRYRGGFLIDQKNSIQINCDIDIKVNPFIFNSFVKKYVCLCSIILSKTKLTKFLDLTLSHVKKLFISNSSHL